METLHGMANLCIRRACGFAALGIATLLFMVGASLGSAVVGGLGPVLGLPGSILALTALPALGLLLLVPNLRRAV